MAALIAPKSRRSSRQHIVAVPRTSGSTTTPSGRSPRPPVPRRRRAAPANREHGERLLRRQNRALPRPPRPDRPVGGCDGLGREHPKGRPPDLRRVWLLNRPMSACRDLASEGPASLTEDRLPEGSSRGGARSTHRGPSCPGPGRRLRPGGLLGLVKRRRPRCSAHQRRAGRGGRAHGRSALRQGDLPPGGNELEDAGVVGDGAGQVGIVDRRIEAPRDLVVEVVR